jgi:hypothetical protein
MKNIEVQMLLYTLTKEFIEVQVIMLNAFHIILFYKMMRWFDAQDIDVELKRLRLNPPYQHILCGICIFVYIPYTCMYMYNT